MEPRDNYRTQLVVNQTTRKTSTGSKVDTRTSTGKATQTAYRPKKPVGKMALFGAVSLGAYYLLFSNESLVTNTFTLGGWHAAFPVLTAFFFSFIHGAFASNFLSVLGLEAKKR